MKKNKILTLLSVFCTLIVFSFQSIQGQERLYVFKNGLIDFVTDALNLDSAVVNQQATLHMYTGAEVIYSSATSQLDSISFELIKPKANLMDIQFKLDGTATDLSPTQSTVQVIGQGGLTNYYNNTFKKVVAKFSNAYGDDPSSYYKIDYKGNTAFKQALGNSHSIELLVMTSQPIPFPEKESKALGAHDSGGTGVMITKTAAARGQQFTFLPHINGAYVWVDSGVTPEPQHFYHLVGVWNKQTGLAHIYVNGELKKTQAASGNLTFPSNESAHWFCIGGDAAPSKATNGWRGDIATVRVYDKALSLQEINMLWKDIEYDEASATPPLVSNVSFYSGINTTPGNLYTLFGEGFEVGDKIKLVSVDNPSVVLLANLQPNTDGAAFVVPNQLSSGLYSLLLLRGNEEQDLGSCNFILVASLPKAFEVIAHRGYWDTPGSAQNSIASLQKAQELGVHGSEFDVWITTDGEVFINHDASISGVTIQNSTASQVRNIRLSNGELIPTLNDYLIQGKKAPTTKLILEIKSHNSSAKHKAVAKACVDAVKAMGMENQVEYIAFSLEVCQELLLNDPNCIVGYLNGDKEPQYLHNLGIKSIDYKLNILQNNPQWITQAQSLGMIVNVWTVNSPADILEMANAGVDYISTDNPVEAKKIRTLYLKQSGND